MNLVTCELDRIHPIYSDNKIKSNSANQKHFNSFLQLDIEICIAEGPV